MSNTTMDKPEHAVERLARLLSGGELDAALALYEPDAAFLPEPGTVIRGRGPIRAALERFAALDPKLSGEVQRVVEAGDTALVVNRWSLDGTGPDGAAVRMGGLSADVVRRRPDGSWGILIDDPWGGAPQLSK
jgi:uncharacterized protein (TIGR02246 family)